MKFLSILITFLLIISCDSNQELNKLHYNKAEKYYTDYDLTRNEAKIDSAFEELKKISDVNDIINDYNYGVLYKVYLKKEEFKELKEILSKNKSLNDELRKFTLGLVSYYQNCKTPDIAMKYLKEIQESDVLYSIRLSYGDLDYFVGKFLLESLMYGQEKTMNKLERYYQSDSLDMVDYNIILEILQEDSMNCE